MKELVIRIASVLIIVGGLITYNAVWDSREKDDKIARLTADLETAQLKIAAGTTAEETENSKNYVDGVYTGESDGFGGPISVEVTVTDGAIEGIKIVSAEKEDGAYLSMAEDIIPAIVQEQSADVDTISGATFSSTGIKNAAIQALEKAKK